MGNLKENAWLIAEKSQYRLYEVFRNKLKNRMNEAIQVVIARCQHQFKAYKRKPQKPQKMLKFHRSTFIIFISENISIASFIDQHLVK